MIPGFRRLLYGANLIIIIIVMFLLAVVINYLGKHYNKRIDLTASKQFTLSEQTIKTINSLKKPVLISTFFNKKNPNRQRIYDLLAEYDNLSANITVDKVDPIANPSKTQEKGITSYGVVLFESGSKREVTTVFGEQEVTQSLIKISKEETKVIYFLSGHGEHDSKNDKPNGYSEIRTRLANQGYQAKTLEFFQSAPADCDLLVIAGADKALLPSEVTAVENYLEQGGRLLLLLDPGIEVGLEKLMAKWGVAIGDDLVVDPASSFSKDVTTPVIVRYYQHPIVYGLSATFFPRVRSVSKEEDIGDQLTVLPVMMTTANGWAEKNPDKLQFDKDVDLAGPVTICVSAVKSLLIKTAGGSDVRYARVLVLGDSDFATNSFIKMLSNSDLFINSVNWLLEDEDLISIRPKEPDERKIQLTGSQVRSLFVINVLVAPLSVMVIGTLIWWRYRS